MNEPCNDKTAQETERRDEQVDKGCYDKPTPDHAWRMDDKRTRRLMSSRRCCESKR